MSYLVLDEADRMLDAGFENDIRRIIAHTAGHKEGRQTVMCEFSCALSAKLMIYPDGFVTIKSPLPGPRA